VNDPLPSEQSQVCSLDELRLLATRLLIGWPRTLTWDDFRVVYRLPKGYAHDTRAWLSAGFRYYFSPARCEGGRYGPGNLRVEVFVDREKTGVLWWRRGRRLLRHEQGHLDVAGICAREFCVQLSRTRAATPSQLIADARSLLRDAETRLRALNHRYDSFFRGTAHGLNWFVQRRWNRLLREARDSWKPLPEVKPLAAPLPGRSRSRFWRFLNTPILDLLWPRQGDA